MNKVILSKRITVKKLQIYLIKGASHKMIFLIGSDIISGLDWKLLAGNSVRGVSVRQILGCSCLVVVSLKLNVAHTALGQLN